MEKNRYLFTVFTPTYNRSHTLHLVFNSLKNQTLKRLQGKPVFEWIIVDDGSTDNTRERVDRFIKKATFPIRYFYQENSGKHIAINRGVTFAKGKFFLIADSDDAFSSKTLHTFFFSWNKLSSDQKSICSGINCFSLNGKTMSAIGDIDQFNPVELISELPYILKNRIYYDRWVVTLTDIHREFPFPELKNVKFIPEGFIWNRIGRKYKRLNIKKILRIVYYQDDGLSKNILDSYMLNGKSHYFYHLTNLIENWDLLFSFDKMRFVKEIIQVNRMGIHIKINFFYTFLQFKSQFFLAFLLIFFYPISLSLSIFDHFNYMKRKNNY